MIQTIMKWVLFGVLFVSGVSKLIDPMPAITMLDAIEIIPKIVIEPIVSLLPVFEIALSLLVVCQYKTKTFYTVMLATFLFFFIFSIVGTLSGLKGDCGCFGSLIKSEFDLFMIVRNLIFVLMAFYLFKKEVYSFKFYFPGREKLKYD